MMMMMIIIIIIAFSLHIDLTTCLPVTKTAQGYN